MNLSELTDAFRKAMVDVLIPEIRLLRVEMNDRFSAIQKNMDDRFNAMQKNMDDRFNAMQKQMDDRFTKSDEKFEKMMEILVEIRIDVSSLKNKDKINDWMLNRMMRLENDMDQVKQRLAAA